MAEHVRPAMLLEAKGEDVAACGNNLHVIPGTLCERVECARRSGVRACCAAPTWAKADGYVRSVKGSRRDGSSIPGLVLPIVSTSVIDGVGHEVDCGRAQVLQRERHVRAGRESVALMGQGLAGRGRARGLLELYIVCHDKEDHVAIHGSKRERITG